MKRVYWIILIVLGVILIGFIIGLIIPPKGASCTKMGCPCDGVEGDRPCNECSSSDIFFVLGIVNVVKKCQGEEIINCANGQQVSKRIVSGQCRYDPYVLWFNLRYLVNNPSRPVIYNIGD